MNNKSVSLGMIETYGFIGLVAASDAAAKAAQVEVVNYQQAGSGIGTAYLIGDVASVQAAVAVGAEEAKRIGHLRYSHVIPRPDEDVLKMINKLKKKSENSSTSKEEPEVELKKKSEVVEESSTTETKDAKTRSKEIEEMTIAELRTIAYSSKEISLSNQEIKTSKKDELVKEILKIKR